MAVQLPWSDPKTVDMDHEGFNVTGLWSNPGYYASQRPTAVWNLVDDDGEFVPMVMTPVTA